MTRSLSRAALPPRSSRAAIVAAPAAQTPTPADDALIKKARGIHERVIALDTHDDINPDNFTAERNYTQDLATRSTCRRWSRAASTPRSSSSTSARDR